jgi:hypothetical protein
MPNSSSGEQYQRSAALTQSNSTSEVFVEFTKLVKYGAASLFLILVIHGLVLGFTIPTTVLSVVLVSVVCLFEAQLVKTERDDQEERLQLIVSEFKEQVRKLSETQYSDKKEVLVKQAEDKEELLKRIDDTRSQMTAIKLSQGIKRL